MREAFDFDSPAILYRGLIDLQDRGQEVAQGPLVILARGVLSLPYREREMLAIYCEGEVLRTRDMRLVVSGWFAIQPDRFGMPDQPAA